MKTFILASAIALVALACPSSAAEINIIPTPASVEMGKGSFLLSSSTSLAAKGADAKEVLAYFEEKVSKATGFSFKKGKAEASGTISFVIDSTIEGREAYTLTVTTDKIVARASTSDGLFYAMQSLLQLMDPAVETTLGKGKKSWEVPAIYIADAPRFEYRGVMLDPCRHFLPVSAVKKQIEVLSAYKINKLHWHLTDDQGWRIEIKKYPLLTQIGSKRIEGDGTVHGGFYTQAEIREVVEYAKLHHMDVIPELEMPGHELAAIAAYPELSCTGEETTPRIIWGVEDVVMCPGKEKMFEFLQGVIDEMVPLFPSEYFHIGGDESPRTEWAKCALCQARMKEQGLTDEAQLQSYIIGRMEKYLRAKGKTVIGWDEILEGGNLDTTAVVMSWRGEEGGITAAKAGHPVLMTPSTQGFYFDQFQGDYVLEPATIGGNSPLEKVYSYNPVPQEVHAAGKDRLILGVQANCWSEYMHSPATLEYRLYPRALALAEVAWTQPENKDFEDFKRRVDSDAALRLKARQINFHIPQPEQPEGSCNHIAFVDSGLLTLTTTRPLPIVYTTDGTQPTEKSQRYTTPIVLDHSAVISTATVLPCGILSPVRTIYADKVAFSPATKLDSVVPGLLLTKWNGDFFRPLQVVGEPVLKDSVIAGTEVLRNLTYVPGNVRNVQNYAADAEGYIEIAETGVYEFRSDNTLVLIDGKEVVDNTLESIPRFSPNGSQIALEAGLHRFKVLFIGGIFAGWPTYWNDGAVRFRRGTEPWQYVKPNILFHAP